MVRSDETESGLSLADYYDWDSGKSMLQLQSTARLSASVATIQWMQAGALQEGERAVFITARDAGADETSRAITDILACRQSELANIVLSSDTGFTTQIARFLNLPPGDVNGDGATEVPRPAELPTKIYWYCYTADGADSAQAITYHNLTDSWYLLIPEQWDGRFTVRQTNVSSAVHATTFYSVRGRSPGEELLTIYTLTGADRETQASKSGRALLRRRTDTVYAISYSAGYDEWSYAVDRSVVEESFKPIEKRWSMGEN